MQASVAVDASESLRGQMTETVRKWLRCLCWFGAGLGFMGYAVHALVTGEVNAGRRGTLLIVTPTVSPEVYWASVLVSGLFGAFLTWLGWQKARRRI